jgi:hypothetical protein
VHAGSGENLTYNHPTGTNNGKVSSMYNAVSGETVTYTYDSLNRMVAAGGSGWGEAYTFDPFGNLGGYDANGNAFLANVAYDVENRFTPCSTGHPMASILTTPRANVSSCRRARWIATATSTIIPS